MGGQGRARPGVDRESIGNQWGKTGTRHVLSQLHNCKCPPLPAHPGKEKYIIDKQSTGPLIRTDGLFRRECNEKHKKPRHRDPRQNTFQLQGKGTGLSSNARTLHDRLDAPLGHGLVSFPL